MQIDEGAVLSKALVMDRTTTNISGSCLHGLSSYKGSSGLLHFTRALGSQERGQAGAPGHVVSQHWGQSPTRAPGRGLS